MLRAEADGIDNSQGKAYHKEGTECCFHITFDSLN